jgi:uncharacterized membrane protein
MKTNTFIGMIATIAMTLVSSAAMAWGPGHGWGPGVAMGYGGMTIFWIFAIIAFAGLLCLAICLSRRSVRNKKKESLLNVLSERYARGEITKEEFDGTTKDLREESLLAILIPRYARGEITKEEFERIKKDSEELCNAC